LDCLIDVIVVALRDKREYPDESSPEFQVLAKLGEPARIGGRRVFTMTDILRISEKLQIDLVQQMQAGGRNDK
jgi:hypothetical protein